MKKTVLAVLAACSVLGAGSASAATVSINPNSMWNVANQQSFSINGSTSPYYLELNTPSIFDSTATLNLLNITPGNGGTRTVKAQVFVDTDSQAGFSVYDDSSFIASAVLSQGGAGLTFLVDHTKDYVVRLFDFNPGGPLTSFNASVSAVPLPAAVWLFGSALLGFLGLSNRRKL